MVERGVVMRSSAGYVDVAIRPSGACETCGACAEGADGMRLLEGVVDTKGARVGDRVEIEIPLRARYRAQALVFVLPVGMLVVGYVAGSLLGQMLGVDPDSLGAVAGIAAGVAMFLGLRRFGSNTTNKNENQSQVRAILS